MAKVQIIPLGGAGEIGRNCTCVIHGDDMILIDCGISFPNEEQFGVDIVLPDFSFIIENRQKLKAIFLTHAHEDHVGALPYLLARVKAPIYSADYTLAMIRNKLDERMDVAQLEFVRLNPGKSAQIGSMKLESIRVTHSIPDATAAAIHTPEGVILFTGDYKFDPTPVDGKLSDEKRLKELGDSGVLCLVGDSTNVERRGWGPSESEVTPGFRKLFDDAEGRVIVTMFASNIHRMQQVFNVAAETGRKVASAGRRMDVTIDMCSRLGYLDLPPNTRIRLDESHSYKPHELVVLTTGSQGEPMSALVQMSKKEYSRMQVMDGDTIVYSARPIPGNEAAIWRTVNRLFRMGATVIYDAEFPIHVSGHAYRDEISHMLKLTRPKYIAPVHGEPRHQYLFEQLAIGMGYDPEAIFTMVDGFPLELTKKSADFGEAVPSGRIYVDNGGRAVVTDEILRDRGNLANDGMIMITLALDTAKGTVIGSPELQTKGFSGELDVCQKSIEIVDDALRAMRTTDLQDVDFVRQEIHSVVRRYIQKRTSLRPVVIPSILEI